MRESCLLSCIHLNLVRTSVLHSLDCINLLLIEEGIGLLIPNGILTVSRALLELNYLAECLSS